MRHRSRSRNYDSNDNYKSRRSSPKYESSRSHKSKVVHSHYSSDSRRHDSSKVKKSSDRSRYDHHRDRESDSEDKYDKKMDDYDRDCKKSKYSSKYGRADSPVTKHSRKYDSYTHSYKRRSISSDLSNHSYESKYRKTEDKSDNKRSYVKAPKESKRSRLSRTPSSEELSDVKIKTENKDKVKDKKLKKKAKKSDKDKKKRKRQKHSTDEEVKDTDNTKRTEEKIKSSKHSEQEDSESNKDKLKLEPFKVKETSNLKSQINFLNPSNIFTKDEWQKESSDDDLHRKEPKKEKRENSEADSVKEVKLEKVSHEEIKDSNGKKSEENDCSEKDRSRRKRKSNQSKTVETTKNPKPAEAEEEKSLLKTNYESVAPKEKPHTHSKSSEQSKSAENKEKSKTKDLRTSQKTIDDRKKVEDSFEDERIELPRSPTDAQYIGLFARLQEEPVSDTEIELILPPILLDDRMKALLINDPNVTQEAWDSEDDVLLSKRENIIAPKHRGVLETLAVPWKLLIDEASLNKNKDRASSSSRFDVSNVVENIGVSRKLGGEILWKRCLGKFLNPIPPLHQTLMSQKSRRNSIFCERGLFAGALSARKDLFIRRVLYEPIT